MFKQWQKCALIQCVLIFCCYINCKKNYICVYAKILFNICTILWTNNKKFFCPSFNKFTSFSIATETFSCYLMIHVDVTCIFVIFYLVKLKLYIHINVCIYINIFRIISTILKTLFFADHFIFYYYLLVSMMCNTSSVVA